MANYDKGDLVRITGTFTDSAGDATDPAAVYFKFTTPAGATTSYQYGVDAEIVKSSTGIYYVDVDANASGTWYYRYYSTGTGQAAEEGAFTIDRSNF